MATSPIVKSAWACGPARRRQAPRVTMWTVTMDARGRRTAAPSDNRTVVQFEKTPVRPFSRTDKFSGLSIQRILRADPCHAVTACRGPPGLRWTIAVRFWTLGDYFPRLSTG